MNSVDVRPDQIGAGYISSGSFPLHSPLVIFVASSVHGYQNIATCQFSLSSKVDRKLFLLQYRVSIVSKIERLSKLKLD